MYTYIIYVYIHKHIYTYTYIYIYIHTYISNSHRRDGPGVLLEDQQPPRYPADPEPTSVVSPSRTKEGGVGY